MATSYTGPITRSRARTLAAQDAAPAPRAEPAAAQSPVPRRPGSREGAATHAPAQPAAGLRALPAELFRGVVSDLAASDVPALLSLASVDSLTREDVRSIVDVVRLARIGALASAALAADPGWRIGGVGLHLMRRRYAALMPYLSPAQARQLAAAPALQSTAAAPPVSTAAVLRAALHGAPQAGPAQPLPGLTVRALGELAPEDVQRAILSANALARSPEQAVARQALVILNFVAHLRAEAFQPHAAFFELHGADFHQSMLEADARAGFAPTDFRTRANLRRMTGRLPGTSLGSALDALDAEAPRTVVRALGDLAFAIRGLSPARRAAESASIDRVIDRWLETTVAPEALPPGAEPRRVADISPALPLLSEAQNDRVLRGLERPSGEALQRPDRARRARFVAHCEGLTDAQFHRLADLVAPGGRRPRSVEEGKALESLPNALARLPADRRRALAGPLHRMVDALGDAATGELRLVVAFAKAVEAMARVG